MTASAGCKMRCVFCQSSLSFLLTVLIEEEQATWRTPDSGGFAMQYSIHRRSFLQALAALSLSAVLPSLAEAAAASAFSVPNLDYPLGALEPVIDATTMEIHHGKHHAAYVKGLNEALAKNSGRWSNWSVEQLLQNLSDLPLSLQLPVRNMGGGHWNHSFFWKVIGPPDGPPPPGDLKGAIEEAFGSWGSFQQRLNEAAMSRFGSGWAWLVMDKGGRLVVRSTANQDCPLMEGQTPLLGLDVWEHAYYLKYQNLRKDYVDAFWRVIQWEEVARRFRAALE
jgi:Fe-Mn family superoxide dismutase